MREASLVKAPHVLLHEAMERKLVAILMADVAGYSRLMEANEVGTLELLMENRRTTFDPCVAKHRGRIVKTMGDGVLIEFPSVVTATECAVALQTSMANATDQTILYRIGVNLGDVIVRDDDMYGDGVNVAARLQALSPVGGIAVSGAVRDQIAGKVSASFDDLGQHEVKNIERPIHVYLVHPAGLANQPKETPEWERNHANLAGLADQTLPGDSVSLAQVYVPLRAMRRVPFADLPKDLRDKLQAEFEKKGAESGGHYYLAADLEELLVGWLTGAKERFDE